MTRNLKSGIVTVFAAIAAWLIGTVLIGFADVRYVTRSGVVDMADPLKVSAAASDPTFTAFVSIAGVTLQGAYWTVLLPILLALMVAALVAAVQRAVRRSE